MTTCISRSSCISSTCTSCAAMVATSTSPIMTSTSRPAESQRLGVGGTGAPQPTFNEGDSWQRSSSCCCCCARARAVRPTSACSLSEDPHLPACQCHCRVTTTPPTSTSTTTTTLVTSASTLQPVLAGGAEQDHIQNDSSHPVITSHRDYHPLSSPSSSPSAPVRPRLSGVMSNHHPHDRDRDRDHNRAASSCCCPVMPPSNHACRTDDRSSQPSTLSSCLRYTNHHVPPAARGGSSSSTSTHLSSEMHCPPVVAHHNGGSHDVVSAPTRRNGNVVVLDHRRDNHYNSNNNVGRDGSEDVEPWMMVGADGGQFHHFHHHHHHHHLTVMNGTLVSKVLSAPSNAAASTPVPHSSLSSARLARRSAPDLSVLRRRTVGNSQPSHSHPHSHSNFHPLPSSSSPPPPPLPPYTPTDPTSATTCCVSSSAVATPNLSALGASSSPSFPHATTRSSRLPSSSSSSSLAFSSSSRRRPRSATTPSLTAVTGPSAVACDPAINSTTGASDPVCSECLAKHFQTTSLSGDDVHSGSTTNYNSGVGGTALVPGLNSDVVSDSDLDSEEESEQAESDSNSDLHYNIDLQHPASSSSSSSPLPPPAVSRGGHPVACLHDENVGQYCSNSRRCCCPSQQFLEPQPQVSLPLAQAQRYSLQGLASSVSCTEPSVSETRGDFHSHQNYHRNQQDIYSGNLCQFQQSRQLSCVASPSSDDDAESRLAHLHLASSDALISAHNCIAMLARSYVHSPPTAPLSRPPHVPRLAGLPTWADDADQLQDAALDDLHRASAASAHSSLPPPQPRQLPPPLGRESAQTSFHDCGNEDQYGAGIQHQHALQHHPHHHHHLRDYRSAVSQEEDLMYADAETDNHLQNQNEDLSDMPSNNQVNHVVEASSTCVSGRISRCGDFVVDDDIDEEEEEDLAERHAHVDEGFADEEEEEEVDDDDDVDEDDDDNESVRPASPLNYFIHNGLRYDGDVYQLRPPQERSIASRPERVLEHKPPTLANRQVFNRVYSEGTFNARPSSLRQPDASVDESPPNVSRRYVSDDVPIAPRPVTRPPSVRPSAPIVVPPNIISQSSSVSPVVAIGCTSGSVPVCSPSLNSDSDSDSTTTTSTSNIPICVSANRTGAVGGGEEFINGGGEFSIIGGEGSDGSQLYYKHGFAGTPPQQAQAVLHTLAGDENGVPLVRPRGRSYGAFASSGDGGAMLPSSLPRPRATKPSYQQRSQPPPLSTSSDSSRSGRIPSVTNRRSSLWKLLSR